MRCGGSCSDNAATTIVAIFYDSSAIIDIPFVDFVFIQGAVETRMKRERISRAGLLK